MLAIVTYPTINMKEETLRDEMLKENWSVCEICHQRKPDVGERPNAYDKDVNNNPESTHIVCDECDYQNRMDI